MEMSLCLVMGLLLWTSSEGLNQQTVVVEINQDLQLEFPDSYTGGTEIFLWRYNSYNIVRSFGDRTMINVNYKDRIEFSPQNLSLILKNVQLSDSGTYSAMVSRSSDETLFEYEVIVEGPSSAVELKLSLVSVSNTSESCNFTVSCTTELYSISRSFTCDTYTCEDPRPSTHGHTPSGHGNYGHAHFGSSSLHLYLSNLLIICNHSNHISWTTDNKDIHEMCITTGETGPEEVLGLSVCLMKTLLYSVGLLLMLSALITVHVLEHRNKQD